MILVADASAIGEYLFRTQRSIRVAPLLEAAENQLHAPSVCELELASILARALRGGHMSDERARELLDDYFGLGIALHGHRQLLSRVLGLWANLSTYDASYVALAERLGGVLVTADAPLARAAGSLTSLNVVSV